MCAVTSSGSFLSSHICSILDPGLSQGCSPLYHLFYCDEPWPVQSLLRFSNCSRKSASQEHLAHVLVHLGRNWYSLGIHLLVPEHSAPKFPPYPAMVLGWFHKWVVGILGAQARSRQLPLHRTHVHRLCLESGR